MIARVAHVRGAKIVCPVAQGVSSAPRRDSRTPSARPECVYAHGEYAFGEYHGARPVRPRRGVLPSSANPEPGRGAAGTAPTARLAGAFRFVVDGAVFVECGAAGSDRGPGLVRPARAVGTPGASGWYARRERLVRPGRGVRPARLVAACSGYHERAQGAAVPVPTARSARALGLCSWSVLLGWSTVYREHCCVAHGPWRRWCRLRGFCVGMFVVDGAVFAGCGHAECARRARPVRLAPWASPPSAHREGCDRAHGASRVAHGETLVRLVAHAHGEN